MSKSISANLPKNKILVTFLGRLEVSKSPREFLEAFNKICAKTPNRFHAVVIGSGSMEKQLKNYVSNKRINKFVSFFKNLSFDEVYTILKKTDIYVSLNRYGNLSNSNLEAMAIGKAIIIPMSQKEKGIDLYTDNMITNDSVIRLKSPDSIEEISKSIFFLAKNKQKKIKMETKIKSIAEKYLMTWEDRINWEINFINLTINSNKNEVLKYFENNSVAENTKKIST